MFGCSDVEEIKNYVLKNNVLDYSDFHDPNLSEFIKNITGLKDVVEVLPAETSHNDKISIYSKLSNSPNTSEQEKSRYIYIAVNYVVSNNLHIDKKYKKVVSILIKKLEEAECCPSETNPFLNKNLWVSKTLNLYKC